MEHTLVAAPDLHRAETPMFDLSCVEFGRLFSLVQTASPA